MRTYTVELVGQEPRLMYQVEAETVSVQGADTNYPFFEFLDENGTVAAIPYANVHSIMSYKVVTGGAK